MSERGVFAVDRGIWEHPVLASREPFTRREAWIWLISEAAWKPRRRRIGSASIEIARGELAHSVRFIADAWGWPKSNVARFLDALKTETMIGTRTDQGLTVITICNYDEYQRVSLPDRDANGTSSGTEVGHKRDTSGTAAGQQRDKLEDNKNIKKNAADAARGRLSVVPDMPPMTPAELEKSYFDRGKLVLGSNAGGMLKGLLKAKGNNIALARAALETASTKSNPREYIGAVIRGPQQAAQPNWLDGIEGVL